MKKHFKLMGTTFLMMLCMLVSQSVDAQHSLSASSFVTPTAVVSPIVSGITTTVQSLSDGSKRMSLEFPTAFNAASLEAVNDAVIPDSRLEWLLEPSQGGTSAILKVDASISASELNKVFISRGFRLDKNKLIQNF